MSNHEHAFGLDPKMLLDIRKVFNTVPHLQWVKIYGSRAMGNYRSNSDIDLAFSSYTEEDVAGKIWGILENLPTPYQFDVTHYERVSNTALKEHIDRVGISI